MRGQNGVEFHWELNGDGPRHVTSIRHVSTRDFVTFNPFELQTSVRGQNGVEFPWESNGHGPRNVTYVRHVSEARFLFGMVECTCVIFPDKMLPIHEVWSWR